MSELGAVDELGRALPTPALARLFGDQPPDLAGSAPVEARVGRATVVFCPGNFAVGLLEPTAPMKDPKGTVPLPPFAADRTALLDGLLAARLGNQARLFAEPPAQDVEAVLLRDRDRGVLLLTNWDATSPARFRLRAEALSGASSAAGLAISRDAGVRDTRISRTEAGWSVELPAQESCLLRLR
jgi:hypothetical protein